MLTVFTLRNFEMHSKQGIHHEMRIPERDVTCIAYRLIC